MDHIQIDVVFVDNAKNNLDDKRIVLTDVGNKIKHHLSKSSVKHHHPLILKKNVTNVVKKKIIYFN